MTTFWLSIKGVESSSHSGSVSGTERSEDFLASNSHYLVGGKLSPKVLRLVNWNVEILSRLLIQVVARRRATKSELMAKLTMNEEAIDRKLRDGKMVIHEVEEIITLPKYDAEAAKASENSGIQLGDSVVSQLREYVLQIAQSYKDNPFHNFEHASHVTMSVTKLLSRIVAPKAPSANVLASRALADKVLHDHTYGIVSISSVAISFLARRVTHTPVFGFINSRFLETIVMYTTDI